MKRLVTRLEFLFPNRVVCGVSEAQSFSRKFKHSSQYLLRPACQYDTIHKLHYNTPLFQGNKQRSVSSESSSIEGTTLMKRLDGCHTENVPQASTSPSSALDTTAHLGKKPSISSRAGIFPPLPPAPAVALSYSAHSQATLPSCVP